ncbi:MAG: hypothetical protein F6K26_15725 [Moorea sp. SIO2I5]|nr:hypothetical protein [Moorena sp. SIO2I5]
MNYTGFLPYSLLSVTYHLFLQAKDAGISGGSSNQNNGIILILVIPLFLGIVTDFISKLMYNLTINLINIITKAETPIMENKILRFIIRAFLIFGILLTPPHNNNTQQIAKLTGALGTPMIASGLQYNQKRREQKFLPEASLEKKEK